MGKIQIAINKIEVMSDLTSALANDAESSAMAYKNQTLAFDSSLISLRQLLDSTDRSIAEEIISGYEETSSN